MHVLFVLTSHDELGDTGKKTGFWLEEFTSPYYTMIDKGVKVTLASPQGGQPPLDPMSDEPDAQTSSTERFKADSAAQQQLANTVKLSDVNADQFDAVFYPGGHGPLWDLVNDDNSIRLIGQFIEQGKPIAAVCHAPAVFKNVCDKSGKPYVNGKKVTGFTNSEEAAVELTDVVPFLLEDMLKEAGANYQKTDDWQTLVVKDGNLITGQNPGSSEAVANELFEHLTNH
ncbi:type 1 glutamine amidotransferase domain-containing protein [Aliiglaciecola litoralis]|uniref:Type 1 glutamine amidotransferase domain-containing protein n=1 Tax=Aliiglaciecola litoralis TaxID=582857 RepID=A0ABP3X3P7_9ALTE